MKIALTVNTALVPLFALLALHGLDAAAQISAPAAAAKPPGLYVQVLDGQIALSNSAGSTTVAAGQFGYTPGFKQPPVMVPANPGIPFTPPPAFSTATQPGGASTPVKSNTVDCEVR